MIAGVGIDVVDVASFRSLAAPSTPGARSRFIDATFTEQEVRYCESEAHGEAVLHFAGRFACKEAAVKALDVAAAQLDLEPRPVPLIDVEVVRDARGRPTLRFTGSARTLIDALEIDRAHVSLSHDGGTAAGMVVLERRSR